MPWCLLFLAQACTTDLLAEPLDFGLIHIRVGHPEERRHCLLRRTREVGANHMGQHVIASLFGGTSGVVDIARPVLPVADELLLSARRGTRPRNPPGGAMRARNEFHDGEIAVKIRGNSERRTIVAVASAFSVLLGFGSSSIHSLGGLHQRMPADDAAQLAPRRR